MHFYQTYQKLLLQTSFFWKQTPTAQCFSASLQLPSAWCALSHCGFSLPAPFQGGSRPRGLDVHVNGESHFYSNWRYLGSTTTSGFNARGASQKFQQIKFSAESSQPALNPAHSTVVCTALAPWEQHCRPCWAQLACPIPHEADNTISSNSRCSCILWKNITWEHLESWFSVQFCCLSEEYFSLSKPFPLECRGRSSSTVVWGEGHGRVQSSKTLWLLLTVGTVSPSAPGLSSSSCEKGRCSTGTRQRGSTPFLSNCNSPADFPTAEDKTMLKSLPDPSSVEIRLIFLWGQRLRLCLQIASGELLIINSV